MSMVNRKVFSFFAFVVVALLLLATSVRQSGSEPLIAATASSDNILIALPHTLPCQINEGTAPELTARAVLVIEPESQTILYQYRPDEKLPIASLTKLMTALVAFKNLPLSREVYVRTVENNGSQMGLMLDETLSVESLLWGLLLNSGNDAAVSLGQAYPGGISAFVNEMNRKAGELNLQDTHFVNLVGWHDSQHYSTVMDMALLSKNFLNQPFLAQLVSTQSKIVTSIPREKSSCACNTSVPVIVKRWYHLKNTHPLLGEVDGVTGIKTGYTQEAGECLITYVDRSAQKLLIVILGSDDRDAETKALINWSYKNWRW
ncbi:D-alanyl-D-alanine carboxypeptidase [Patescibacteria group bacterium]|nr:D-alanyl-D-alanine carboxypeptidase [Patescibacteria group bacterium]